MSTPEERIAELEAERAQDAIALDCLDELCSAFKAALTTLCDAISELVVTARLLLDETAHPK